MNRMPIAALVFGKQKYVGFGFTVLRLSLENSVRHCASVARPPLGGDSGTSTGRQSVAKTANAKQ